MDKKLLINVRDFIGMPPRAVLYTQIQQHTGESDKKLEKVLDKLAEMDQIALWNGAWIAGNPVAKLDNLTKDDIEWLTGTGYYAQ